MNRGGFSQKYDAFIYDSKSAETSIPFDLVRHIDRMSTTEFMRYQHILREKEHQVKRETAKGVDVMKKFFTDAQEYEDVFKTLTGVITNTGWFQPTFFSMDNHEWKISFHELRTDCTFSTNFVEYQVNMGLLPDDVQARWIPDHYPFSPRFKEFARCVTLYLMEMRQRYFFEK